MKMLKTSRLYAILHDRTWLILLAVLTFLLLSMQNNDLSKSIKTHNDILRELNAVENTDRGKLQESDILQNYYRAYGVEAASVREFVEEHLDTVMRDMKRWVVNRLSNPLFLSLFCIVPCFMAGHALSDPKARSPRRVMTLLLETLLILLLLNALTKMILVQKWAFHARVTQFNPVPPMDWLKMLLLQPVTYYSLFLLPLCFLVCAFRSRVPAIVATVLVTIALYLTWQGDLLYFFLNTAANHLVCPLKDYLMPTNEHVARTMLLCAVLFTVWTTATVLAARRVSTR